MSINCLKQNIDVIVDLSYINLNWFFDIMVSSLKWPLNIQLYIAQYSKLHNIVCNTYIYCTAQLLIEDCTCSKLIAQYLIICTHKDIDVCCIIAVLNFKSLKLCPVTKNRSVLLIVLAVKLFFSLLYFVL